MAMFHPYVNAPKIPEGEAIQLRDLVAGAEIELEVGPGRGGFIHERAMAVPDIAIFGIEIRRKWSQLLDEKCTKLGLGARVRVFAGDAKEEMPRLQPSGGLARIFMHFPDPWWKKRHAKRLVVSDVFLDECYRLLRDGGELFIQTDVEERAAEYIEWINKFGKFRPFGDEAGSPRLVDHPYLGRSHREKRAMLDGIPIYRIRYKK